MPSVTYQYAVNAGYKFNIVKIGENIYDDLAYYHKENFPDVKVTRPNITTDFSLLHEKALMTVNGFIYPTIYNNTNNDLYIPNATLSMLKSRNNQIGILSFYYLNEPMKKISITEDMIFPDSNFSLFEKAFISFSEPVNRPILILAGYMIFEHPEYFYRISDNTFVLRLEKLNYVEKFYELNRYRDIFKELDVPVSNNNISVVDGQLVRSDETIKKFLTLFNSFLVDLPVNDLSLSRIYLERSHVPGNFRTEIEPMYPIIVGYGKVAEYLKKKNIDTKYTVYTLDAYYNNHLFSYFDYNRLNIYNDHRVVGSTYFLSHTFFLKIDYS